MIEVGMECKYGRAINTVRDQERLRCVEEAGLEDKHELGGRIAPTNSVIKRRLHSVFKGNDARCLKVVTYAGREVPKVTGILRDAKWLA